LIAEVAIGSRIRDYTLESLIGAGPVGSVYRASHPALGTVTLKAIPDAAFASPAARERCVHELRLARAVQHPALLEIHDVGEAGSLLFVAYRYVGALDLGTLVSERGPIPYIRAARLLRQVGEAIDALHARGVSHRNVKPSNVLVANDRAYLVDPAMPADPRDPDGLCAGMLPFTAPELLGAREGGGGDDVYALGCVMYQAVTGRPPFEAGSRAETVIRIARARPAPASRRAAGAPAELDAALVRALEKDPRVRFGSGRELGDALVAAAKGHIVDKWERTLSTGSTAVPPSPPSEPAVAAGADEEGWDAWKKTVKPQPQVEPAGRDSEAGDRAAAAEAKPQPERPPAPAAEAGEPPAAEPPAASAEAAPAREAKPGQPAPGESDRKIEPDELGEPRYVPPGVAAPKRRIMRRRAKKTRSGAEIAAGAAAGEQAESRRPTAEPAAAEPKAAGPAKPPADEPKAAAPAKPPADEPKAAAPANPPADEPKAAAPANPPADEPKAAAPAKPSAARPKPPPERRRRSRTLAGAGAALLAAAAIAVIVLAATGTFNSSKKAAPAAVPAAPAHPRAPSTARTRPRPAAPRPRPAAQLTAWPAGRTAYTVVVFVSPADRGATAAIARRALSLGIPAGVLRSDDHPPLPAGYWVAFAGIYNSQEAAQREADAVRAARVVPSPYVRQIVG
jgi:hypothetical protein